MFNVSNPRLRAIRVAKNLLLIHKILLIKNKMVSSGHGRRGVGLQHYLSSASMKDNKEIDSEQ